MKSEVIGDLRSVSLREVDVRLVLNDETSSWSLRTEIVISKAKVREGIRHLQDKLSAIECGGKALVDMGIPEDPGADDFTGRTFGEIIVTGRSNTRQSICL